MKTADLGDYLHLRRWVNNPWQVVRYRKQQILGSELQVDVRDGPPLYLRGGLADFHMFHRIFLRDEYRLASLGRLGCVVDLGANVGLFAARVARQCERVVSYEPVPENFDALVRNTRELPSVEAVQAAVAGRKGSLKLFAPRNQGQSGTFSSNPGFADQMSEKSIEVPAIPLAELFERHSIDRCDLLKIDVEGSEYEILYATDAALFERIERIHGEYHEVHSDDPALQGPRLAEHLERQGFRVRLEMHRHKAGRGMFRAQRPKPNA